MARGKRPEQPAEEGAPAWMNTYGDMVTLLLTFFVLLFSFSSVDTQKWQELVSSFSGMRVVAIPPLDPYEVVGPGEGNSEQPIVTPAPSDAVDSKGTIVYFDKLYHRIRSHIRDNGLELKLNVEKHETVILLRVTDSALFDSGNAVIRADAQQMLDDVANIFDEYKDAIAMIRIEGHTDNVPIANSRYESNWELSTGRAVSVLNYFIEKTSIPPKKYSAVGYSEYHPVASNDTEEGRAQNRRVDFLIESVTELE